MNKENIYKLVALAIIVTSLTSVLFAFIIWLDRTDCEARGGTFSMGSNILTLSSTCRIDYTEMICTENGVKVDCEDPEETGIVII